MRLGLACIQEDHEEAVGLIAPDEAARYLAQLTQDFLDPAQLDLLPFELITGATELRRAYDERIAPPLQAHQYVELLKEKLADEREAFTPTVYIPLVVDLACAAIPPDALAKVQRRFRLLDRGPAQVRQHGTAAPKRKPRAAP